jgi:hypothetical protein
VEGKKMPCDSQITTEVHLIKGVTSLDTLVEALRAAGYQNVRLSGDVIYFTTEEGNSATYQDGQISVQKNRYSRSENPVEMTRKIKEEYARKTVEQAALRFGFSVKKDRNGRMTVSKRSGGARGADSIQIEVTKDGIIKSTTDKVSGVNHKAASEFFTFMARMAGTTNVVRSRKVSFGINEVHDHEHLHLGEDHSH